MLLEAKQLYASFLENLADSIDLTEAQHKEAKAKYTAVGNFLSARNSLLSPFKPRVLPQGSIRIGTTVRPVGEDGEFDIDLTCVLEANLPEKQENLRTALEARLKQSDNYQRMLSEEEHRRCLRLHYSTDPKFHLDVVPAIQDEYNWLLGQGIEGEYAQHAILISDTQSPTFKENVGRSEWPKSNTEGYALWFLDQMKFEAESIRMKMKAELLLESVDDVPDYAVRTPLQRGVQLLKRHRDLEFQDRLDTKPVSIIITTIAARAYSHVMRNPPSRNFYDILLAMVNAMPLFIKREAGEYFIDNPVNCEENFADKWNDNPLKAKRFFEWLDKFKYDFQQSVHKNDLQSAISYIRPMYGNRSINEALEKFSKKGKSLLTESKNLPVRFHANHKQVPVWPIKPVHNVAIRCEYRSVSGEWQWADDQGVTIPTDRSLLFHAYTNVPAPFLVFWQVVNTGNEAMKAKSLRGEIFPAKTAGVGGLEQPESTAYVGEHWVQCYIVKDGICLAQSSEYAVNVY